MPVRFTQPAGLDLHERAGDGRRDWKLALRYQAIGAARVGVGALREQLVGMGERPAIERAGRRIGGKWRRDRSLGDVDFALGEICEGRRRYAEILPQHLRRRMADPIADAERAEFREISVVEDEHEQAVLGADALDRVAEPAREIPDVA